MINADPPTIITVAAGIVLLYVGIIGGARMERYFYFGTFFPKIKYGSLDTNGNKIKRSVSRLGDD